MTFLFTDIEDSTRLWERDRDEMHAMLAAHDELLLACIERHGGEQFKHMGDGVCAVFDSATAAVAAAVEAQRSLALPVRMGLFTGDAEPRGGDYFGPALNRAARVMGAAHGGQILVAESTAVLIDRTNLTELGEQTFKGIPEPIIVFQANADGLRATFPPLRTATDTTGNLPSRLADYVGRASIQQCVVDAVRSRSLVTLVGTGGLGKTRLAIESAHELVDEFPSGIWFVELAAIDAPESVVDAVANTLGVTPRPGMSMVESLGSALSDRSMLIVLDNCEHVVHAARKVVDSVCATAPGVKFLATSRERLVASDEQLIELEPLDSTDGADSPAVELFVRRAQAARPSFELGPDAAVVTEICEQLEGNALAIELAAARMSSLTPTEVLDRLGERLRLLTQGLSELEHHRTLRHAVQWSFDLLDDEHRNFARLCAVFADDFSAASAAAVGDLSDEYETLDLLDSLVRKSLITAESIDGRTRYGMLETIRHYALEELTESGAEYEARRRHAEHYAHMVESAWADWDGLAQVEVVDALERDYADLRAAFRWSAAAGELSTAETIASLATIMLFGRQRFEPVGWAEQLTPLAEQEQLVTLPRLYIAASVCVYAGRPTEAVSYIERAIELEEDSRYQSLERGWSGLLAATAYRYVNEIDRSIEICRSLGAGDGLARVIGHCGLLHLLSVVGDLDEAQSRADTTVAIARSHGSPFWIVWALEGCGRAYAETQPLVALTHFREALAFSREHRISYFEGIAVRETAMVEALQGQLDQALAQFDETLESFERAGNVAHVVNSLADLAVLFDRVGHAEAAMIVLGAVGRYVDYASYPRLPEIVERSADELGRSRVDHLLDVGRAMDLPVAMGHAREHIAVARRQLRSEASTA